MKKTVVIFRFGSEMPTVKEYSVIQTISGGSNRAVGCGSRFGTISVIETEYTPKQIERLFTQVAKEHNDSLPVIAFYLDGDTGFNFDKDFFPAAELMLNEFTNLPKESGSNLTIDQILEKIIAQGQESLTDDELKKLRNFSGEL